MHPDTFFFECTHLEAPFSTCLPKGCFLRVSDQVLHFLAFSVRGVSAASTRRKPLLLSPEPPPPLPPPRPMRTCSVAPTQRTPSCMQSREPHRILTRHPPMHGPIAQDSSLYPYQAVGPYIQIDSPTYHSKLQSGISRTAHCENYISSTKSPTSQAAAAPPSSGQATCTSRLDGCSSNQKLTLMLRSCEPRTACHQPSGRYSRSPRRTVATWGCARAKAPCWREAAAARLTSTRE